MPFHCRRAKCALGPVLIVCATLLPACSDNSPPSTESATETTTSNAQTQSTAKPDVASVHACNLITADEVEAIAGRKSSPSIEDKVGNQVSQCYFGEPGAPMVMGKPQGTIVELSVTTGSNGYFKGPVAQVNESFDMVTRNGGNEIQEVDGLGERAHWAADLDTLRLVKGPYLLEIQVSERDKDGNKIAGEPREIARQLATTALTRLP